MKVSEQIRRLIKASGASRRSLCHQIDLDPSIMSRFMNDKGGLSMETLDRLGEVFDIKISAGADAGKGK